MELEEGEEGEIAYAPTAGGAPAPRQQGVPPLPQPRGPPGQHPGYGGGNGWDNRGSRPAFNGGPRAPAPRGGPFAHGQGGQNAQGPGQGPRPGIAGTAGVQGSGYRDVRDVRSQGGPGPVRDVRQGGGPPPPLPPMAMPRGLQHSMQGGGGGGGGGHPSRGPMPPRAGTGLLSQQLPAAFSAEPSRVPPLPQPAHGSEGYPASSHGNSSNSRPLIPGPRGIAPQAALAAATPLRDVRDQRDTGASAAPRPLGLLGSVPTHPHGGPHGGGTASLISLSHAGHASMGMGISRAATAPVGSTQSSSLLGASAARPPLAPTGGSRGGVQSGSVLGTGPGPGPGPGASSLLDKAPLIDVRDKGQGGLLTAPGQPASSSAPRALLSAGTAAPTGLVGARASLIGGVGAGPGAGAAGAPRPSGLLGSGGAPPILGSGLLGQGHANAGSAAMPRPSGLTGGAMGTGRLSLMGGGSTALLQDVRGDRGQPFGPGAGGRTSLLGSDLAHRRGGLMDRESGALPLGLQAQAGSMLGNRGLMGPGRDWRGAGSEYNSSYDHRSEGYGFDASRGVGGGGVLGGGPAGFRTSAMGHTAMTGRPGDKERPGYPQAASTRPGEARMGARDDISRSKPGSGADRGAAARGSQQSGREQPQEEEEEEESGSLADQEDEEERERAEAAAKAKAEAEARAAKYSLVSFTRAAEGTQVPSRFASALLPVLSMHADSAAAKALTEAGAGPAPTGTDVPAGMVVQGGFSFSSPLPATLTSTRVVSAMEGVDNLVRAVTDAIAALETSHLSALKQEAQGRKEAYGAQLAAQAEKEKAKREAEEAAAAAAMKQAEDEASAAAARASSGTASAAAATGAVVLPLHSPSQVSSSQLSELCGISSAGSAEGALHLLKVLSSWTPTAAWLAQASGAPFERPRGKDKAAADDAGDRNAQVQRFIKRTALPSFLQAVDAQLRRVTEEGIGLLVAQGIHLQESGCTALLVDDDSTSNAALPLNERLALQEGGGAGVALRVLSSLPHGWTVTNMDGAQQVTMPPGTPKIAVFSLKTNCQAAPAAYALLASSLALLHAACPPPRPLSISTGSVVVDIPPLLAGNTRKRMQAGALPAPVQPVTCIVAVSTVKAHAQYWKATASDRARSLLANRGKAVWSAMHLQRLHKRDSKTTLQQSADTTFPNGQGHTAYAIVPATVLGKICHLPAADARTSVGQALVTVPAEPQFYGLRSLKNAASHEKVEQAMDVDAAAPSVPSGAVSLPQLGALSQRTGGQKPEGSTNAISPMQWMAEASIRVGGLLYHPSLPRSLQGRLLDLDKLAVLGPAARSAMMNWAASVQPQIQAVLEQNKQTHALVRDYFAGHVHRRRAILRSRQISEAFAYLASREEWVAQVRKHMRARKAKAALAHAAADLRLAASPRPGNILERTGRRAAAVAAAAAIAGKGPAVSSGSAGSALGASGDGAHGLEKDAQPDPIDPAADLPSDSEDEEGGLGGAVRSEWELQQRLEALAVRERKATARLYMTATVPDKIPDKQSRARTRLQYNGVGRYTTDGAPALCSNVPANVPCVTAIRPLAGQAHAADPSAHLPHEVIQGAARGKKMLLQHYKSPFAASADDDELDMEVARPARVSTTSLSGLPTDSTLSLHSMLMTSVDECSAEDAAVSKSARVANRSHGSLANAQVRVRGVGGVVNCDHNIAQGASLPWINGSCNCAVAVELAYKATNPWSDMEKLIFMDVFMAHPKDFTRIASHLPNKTANDCIAFYYATKHVAGYKQRLKAIANWTKKRAGTSAHWLQACGAARDIGVPIPAEISRGAVLKDRSRKLAIVPSRISDLAYSRLFQHPGPYARVVALHRLVTLPLPLTAQSPAVAPLAALSDYYKGGLPASSAAMKQLATLPAVVPGANADFPDNTRNDFIHGYGLGHPSLPWGSKFQARVQGQEESEADPLQYMPTPAAAAAGAGAGVGASLVRVYLAADTYTRSTAGSNASPSGYGAGAAKGSNAASQAQLAMHAAELTRRGIYTHTDLWRLTPPSLLPLSGTQLGQTGSGAGGAWTAARYPVPPAALLAMVGHLARDNTAHLTNLDDERAIALSWKAIISGEAPPLSVRPGIAAKLQQYAHMVEGLGSPPARPAASMALSALQRFFGTPVTVPSVSSLLPKGTTSAPGGGDRDTKGTIAWPTSHDLAGLLAATHTVAACGGSYAAGSSTESSDVVLSPRGKDTAPLAGPGSRAASNRGGNRGGAQDGAALPPGWYPVSGTGPVSVAALGDVYQPTGPTVTLRYFDPLAAPSVIRGQGDQEGMLPYGWLLATADEADAVDVLYARAKARGQGAKARVRKAALALAASRNHARVVYKRELNHNVAHAVATQMGASSAHDAALNVLAEAVRSSGPLFPDAEEADTVDGGGGGHWSDTSDGHDAHVRPTPVPSTAQRVQALTILSRDLNVRRGAVSGSRSHVAVGQGGMALSSTESTPYHSEDEDGHKQHSRASGGVQLGRAYSAPPAFAYSLSTGSGSAGLAGGGDEVPLLAHPANGSVDGESAGEAPSVGDSDMVDASPLTEADAPALELGNSSAHVAEEEEAQQQLQHEEGANAGEDDGADVAEGYGSYGQGLGMKRPREDYQVDEQGQAETGGVGGVEPDDAGEGHEAKYGRYEAAEESRAGEVNQDAAWQGVPASLASAGFAPYREDASGHSGVPFSIPSTGNGAASTPHGSGGNDAEAAAGPGQH